MTTTELARSFADEIIPDDVSSEALEPGRIIWLHGTNKGGAKTSGVFYVKSTEVSETPTSPPWMVDEDRFENETGYSAAALEIAIIGFRSQWFIPQKDEQPFEWLRDYQSGVGAKKLTEYLCLVQGINDPMVISLSGKNKAGPMWEIVKSYQNGLLKQASRMKKRGMPLWSFWLPIANLKKDGKTVYEEARDGAGKSYGSIVTPPALYLPENPLDALYVGAETISYGAQVHNDYADWFKAKRLPQGTVEGHVTVSAPKQLPPARNMPQPLRPDEYAPVSDTEEEVF